VDGAPRPDQVIHCALIPTYTEPYEVLEGTVAALAAQNYPDQQRVVAIITRVSDTGGWENVARLREQFGHRFRAFIHIKDPVLPGVVVGKSAAMAFGGPALPRRVRRDGAGSVQNPGHRPRLDFRLHRQYFAYVTAQFCGADDRLTSIWQPIPLFLNISGAFLRRSGSWRRRQRSGRCSSTTNPRRLVMFSSYTMSMRLAQRCRFTGTTMSSPRTRVLLEEFFHYGDRLNVRPAFLTRARRRARGPRLRLDASLPVHQIKRWAWGVTDIAYVTSG